MLRSEHYSLPRIHSLISPALSPSLSTKIKKKIKHLLACHSGAAVLKETICDGSSSVLKHSFKLGQPGTPETIGRPEVSVLQQGINVWGWVLGKQRMEQISP